MNNMLILAARGPIDPLTVIIIAILVFVLIAFIKTIRIVPQREAYIVERLGKYSTTLEAGFQIGRAHV